MPSPTPSFHTLEPVLVEHLLYPTPDVVVGMNALGDKTVAELYTESIDRYCVPRELSTICAIFSRPYAPSIPTGEECYGPGSSWQSASSIAARNKTDARKNRTDEMFGSEGFVREFFLYLGCISSTLWRHKPLLVLFFFPVLRGLFARDLLGYHGFSFLERTEELLRYFLIGMI